MSTTRFIDAAHTITIDAPADICISDSRARGLIDAVTQLAQAVPLAKLRCKLASPNKWRYTFETVDGRKWSQDLYVVDGKMRQSFETTDQWFEDEFTPHRLVRTYCIELVLTAGVTDIHCNWGA